MNPKITKVLLPILAIVLGLIGARAIIAAKPEARRAQPPQLIPVVETIEAHRGRHTFVVHSQGSVAPRTESALVAEVAGSVLEVDEHFAEGGFFEEGQVLLTLDDRDYRAQVAQAESQVAQATLAVQREEEEARVASDEWKRFDRPGEASALVLREPQLAQARAALAAAEAQLEKARRDLDRTRVRAPYTGRVRQKLADVGDFLQPGAPAAQIYAVDYAEVRVPLPDEELAFLDLPLGLRGAETGVGPKATLRGRFAGQDLEWAGYVERTEGEIDARSRMIHVVVRVADPYGRAAETHGVPLAVGMFVDVGLEGHSRDGVFLLPRRALLEQGRLGVVGSDGRLSLRDVEVLRATRDEIVVASGIEDGDRIVLTRLDVMVDGMTVKTAAPKGDAR